MTKFGISLSGMGQQPVGADMRQSFLEILEYVRTARDLGFDFAYQGQHYLTSPYQQLQTMPLLARLAAEAEGMSLVATLLVPLHHPVDLAERIATMDVITDGRFILSAALGYRDEEYEAFGVQRKQRVSRYLECLEVMKLLWTQDEVSFQGKHFQLKNARMVLKPVQKPHPPIWVAANSDAPIKRAARRGYTWYVNPHATYTTIARQIGLYRQTASEAGSPVPAELPIGRELLSMKTGTGLLKKSGPSWGASTRPTPSGVRTEHCPAKSPSVHPSRSWPGTGLSSATRRTASPSWKSTGRWVWLTAASA